MREREPLLAVRRVNGAPYGRKVSGEMRVYGGLHYLKGNRAPYFALTATVHRSGFRDQVWSCGAMHNEILRQFPKFADLAALHLSDIDGAPTHAAANGLYWIAGAAGGLGEQYHGASGNYGKSAEECLDIAARHFRVASILLPIEALQAAPNKPARLAILESFVDGLRPQWAEEARTCTARHGLRVYGDTSQWPLPGAGSEV